MLNITIITGFLGSGKTTLVNKIIKENPKTRFGLIINEFGEVGVDSELVATTDQEITEISNGCLCCVVRSDLIGAVDKMIKTGKVDHLIIETSGLAEPAPIAQTFIMENLGGKINLDGIYCVIDAENFDANIKDYNILKEQIQTSDVAIINKIDENKTDFNANLTKFITSMNPHISILENNSDFHSKILLDFTMNFEDKVLQLDHLETHHHDHEHTHDHVHDHNEEHAHEHHDHSHHDHVHEHNDFEEVLFSTNKKLDAGKLDQFFLKLFPKNIIRAKGFLNIDDKYFLFQMVGANKQLTEHTLSKDSKIDPSKSYIIFIGKDIDKQLIIESMINCEA
jgi:G3E family GTPase